MSIRAPEEQMRRLLLTAVGFSLLGCAVFPAQASPFAAVIKVRLLNYKTGHPLKRHFVGLVLSDNEGRFPPGATVVNTETDANGMATFSFEVKPSTRVRVLLYLYDTVCNKREEFSIDEVLKQGTFGNADDTRCGPRTSPFPNPQPGEIVFPIHPLNLWQKLWRGLD
jgi:hypothetical protein